ncbi:MAG: hydroxymethylglutaryl-CoA lyase [Anaerolineales bacterium]|uniref:hydroxymethylglutaryl-CoA lyase n=1 Tax=Promineifilum sp. TaxID=2664178 RepID=UPI001D24ADD8|nr:hydroxymethylglutaryl-CoA lyase [Anaerolineales bacterium]MCB8934995.1 hydroxymethylglutaryl-CoA lyase [Promineifilum sp.]MCO5181782.1 hydroxymethylglutaryl-CoA lyase [Promineifilum sp.]
MNDLLKIYEVGPRDGLQNEAVTLSAAQKQRLIDGLVEAGLRHIEATSFVHPLAVPQLADADEVMAGVTTRHAGSGVEFVGLVFNERGYDRALLNGCRSMAFGAAVSETFSLRNTHNTPREALITAHALVERAHRDGIRTRFYVMTAWICPFEGAIPPLKTLAVVQEIADWGVDEIAIADTVGHADPLSVGRLIDLIARRIAMERLAVHLHDTQALGLANATTALQAGIRIFDSSVGGLGGCPFAPGAAGNLATEDLVFLAFKVGLGTGVDFARLWDVVYDLEQIIGRPIGGRIRQWWESSQEHEPRVDFN